MSAVGHFQEVADTISSSLNTAQLLDYLTYAIECAEVARAECVTTLRAEGMSWAEIGAALGISKQGAQQRYGR